MIENRPEVFSMSVCSVCHRHFLDPEELQVHYYEQPTHKEIEDGDDSFVNTDVFVSGAVDAPVDEEKDNSGFGGFGGGGAPASW